MATVSKDRLRELLEDSMADVAMLMADSVGYQQRLLEIRQRVSAVWELADLGEVPEFEVQSKAVKVS
jgi:hypothetical protein